MGVIVRRHRNVVETMATGIMEWRENNDQVEKHRDKIQYFLDRFYTSRIGIRILINQHSLFSLQRLFFIFFIYFSFNFVLQIEVLQKFVFEILNFIFELILKP